MVIVEHEMEQECNWKKERQSEREGEVETIR